MDLYKLINQAKDKVKEDVIELSSERFERRLTEEISKLRVEINERISGLGVKIANNQANLIKWMFIFWIGQIGAILGILFAFFK